MLLFLFFVYSTYCPVVHNGCKAWRRIVGKSSPCQGEGFYLSRPPVGDGRDQTVDSATRKRRPRPKLHEDMHFSVSIIPSANALRLKVIQSLTLRMNRVGQFVQLSDVVFSLHPQRPLGAFSLQTGLLSGMCCNYRSS